MKFEINPQSDEPIHLQLREQIIFRISSKELQIGQVMPSCRALGRQLDIASNTVSSVYKELVDERWLVKRRGSQHVVVQRKTALIPDLAQINSLEDLVDITIHLAQERGYSLQQLAAQLRERLLEQPPDHLLIIEPEREMGELIREEIRQASGLAPSGCSISTLSQNPSMAIGAVLLTPTYLEDGLECIPAKSRHIVPLHYLQVDQHLDAIRNLAHPSSVAMVSISPAALKTASGLLAPVIGERHALREYRMQWPVGGEGPRFHQYSAQDYPERQPVRQFEKAVNLKARGETSTANDLPQSEYDSAPALSSADLKFFDILFCDSIAYTAIKHSRRIRCQLLSNESLAAVAAAPKSLVKR